MLVDSQRRDRRQKRVAKVRILAAATIAGPPGCIHRELHEIGKAADLVRTLRFAAGQRAKCIQVGRSFPVGLQEIIDPDLVG